MPILLVLAAGGAGGFLLGKGADGISNTFKWVVIGGITFIAAKKMKVI